VANGSADEPFPVTSLPDSLFAYQTRRPLPDCGTADVVVVAAAVVDVEVLEVDVEGTVVVVVVVVDVELVLVVGTYPAITWKFRGE
jgi:hypothetical protein